MIYMYMYNSYVYRMVWGNSEAHARLKPQSASNNRLELVAGRSSVAWNVVDRPTQLICISDMTIDLTKLARSSALAAV